MMNLAHVAGAHRWDVAQAAERRYWEQARENDVELLRILHEKAAAMHWAVEQVPASVALPGPWVEIGIGPLGIGCIHLAAAEERELIGIDPLRPMELSSGRLSVAVQSLIAGCRTKAYHHVVGRGEQLELADEVASLVACYNVLDHCDDAAQVVREAARILRTGAYFILGCDVYSFAGRVKYRARATLAKAAGVTLDSIHDLAHPHQFVAADLERIVAHAGLEIVAINNRRAETFKRFWSHAHRVLLVARKQRR